MVDGRTPFFEDSEPLTGISCSRAQHLQELTLADVEGARTGYQHPSRPEHFQGTEIELFVAANGRVQNALGFGEGWRVQNNGVVLLASVGVVPEQVEGV